MQAQASTQPREAREDLAEALIKASRESTQRIKCPVPSLKAADADTLRAELKHLKRYFNEARIDDRRQWFRLSRL